MESIRCREALLELLERFRLMFYQLKYDMDLVDKVIEKKEMLYLWGW